MIEIDKQGETMSELNEHNQLVGQPIPNWRPVERPALKPLKGKYCHLEPIDINKHAEQLFSNLLVDNNGESWTYLPYGPFATYDEFKQWLIETLSDKDTLLYAVIDVSTNQPIGVAGYLRINPNHGSIEVGHLHYSKFLKQSPAATEAMYLMMSYAFDELHYRRYEWKCNSLNQASRNAALRLGFKFEGVFRQCNVFKNRNRDTAWFSIIDSEWPNLKLRFQKWLDPENFDETGKQKLRLNEL